MKLLNDFLRDDAELRTAMFLADFTLKDAQLEKYCRVSQSV